jgi:hypothetical protein
VLLAYAERRDYTYAPRQVLYFFVSSRGTRLIATNVSKVFRHLSRQIGIRDPNAGQGPRIHDFRHYPEFRTIPSKLTVAAPNPLFIGVEAALACESTRHSPVAD